MRVLSFCGLPSNFWFGFETVAIDMDLDSESDDESEVQDIEMINSVLEYDKRSTEASSQCSASTSSIATTQSAGLSSVPRIEVALALNKLTDEKLKRLESILVTRLKDCRQKLADTQRMGQKVKADKQAFLFIHCGKPYFKDKNFFTAPDNQDTTLMKSTGFYDIASVTSVTGWTVKDKRKFIEVILDHSKSIRKKQLYSVICQLNREAKLGNEEENKEKEKQMVAAQYELDRIDKKSLGEIALPIDVEYDWDAVAATLNFRHTPTEYRALWQLFLHPSICKNSWSQKEHASLQRIAQYHKFQDWDTIAQELCTGRTGYQCFVYYRTNMSNKFNSIKWTEEEEEYLKRLIDYYRQDNYIPWGKIVPKMPTRTKLQMYNKYIRLTEKKGRFLPEEDAVLLTCVKKYGTNWRVITNFLKGRSVSQIRLRYQKLSKSQRISCVWTVEEDKKLVQLMATQEVGSYADIVDMFPGKDRVHLRTRHLTLLRFMRRYPKLDIEHAPRRGARRLLHGQASEDLNDALDSLKTRITEKYGRTRATKVTIESPEEAIEHSILVTIMNDHYFANNDESNSDTHGISPGICNDIANLHKLLAILKASLNQSQFKEKTPNKYKDLLRGPEINKFKIMRSYSKKNVVAVDNHAPDIWGDNKLSHTVYVLPPNLSTIIGCKQLLMKYSKGTGAAVKTVKKNIQIWRRKNPLFKEQFALFMERFKTLFLWPMLLSNIQPRLYLHNTTNRPGPSMDGVGVVMHNARHFRGINSNADATPSRTDDEDNIIVAESFGKPFR